jgi:hypothetical protein
MALVEHLLVVGVQYEQHLEGARQHGTRLVARLRGPEHHVQEVLGIAEIVVGVRVGHADAVAVSERGDGGNLGHHPVKRDAPHLGIEHVLTFRIEGG